MMITVIAALSCATIVHGAQLVGTPLGSSFNPSYPSDRLKDGNIYSKTETRYTDSTNPWMALDLGESKYVGQVEVFNYPQFACRLFVQHTNPSDSFDYCQWQYPGNSYSYHGSNGGSTLNVNQGGTHDGPNEGAVVGVSDEPCDSDRCLNAHTCGMITVSNAQNTGHKYTINCNGASGRYVFVRLPGVGRSLQLGEIKVYEGTPPPTASPTSLEQFQAQQLNDALGAFVWQTGTDGDVVYKCDQINNRCFANSPGSRTSWTIFSGIPQVNMGGNAELTTNDGTVFQIDMEKISVIGTDGAVSGFPWECSCN